MITLYGIKNCDTMKKAFKWLDQQGVDYQFHDYKKQGLDPALAQGWLEELGFEALLNKRGTTWRKLDEDSKAAMDDSRAQQTMLDNPSIIKRPLLDLKPGSTGQKHLGFKAEHYQSLFR